MPAALPMELRGVGRSGPAEPRGANPWGCRTRSAVCPRLENTAERFGFWKKAAVLFARRWDTPPFSTSCERGAAPACAVRERMAAERCWHGSARSRSRAGGSVRRASARPCVDCDASFTSQHHARLSAAGRAPISAACRAVRKCFGTPFQHHGRAASA